ncbi:hypothetical protein BE08_21780 [Sorangium cellulosum]|uniref:Uncharacterized protein n=1 Tax=Sorangium cellulosum TaxID=56 RepID=A0A150P2H8_SORCE|nr:hypothetical protein BE08_21780 [Sorangium cellulosum]
MNALPAHAHTVRPSAPSIASCRRAYGSSLVPDPADAALALANTPHPSGGVVVVVVVGGGTSQCKQGGTSSHAVASSAAPSTAAHRNRRTPSNRP